MKNWYYIHSDYKNELANRVSETEVIYNRKIIHGVDGANLIRQGLANEASLKSGKLFAKVKLLPLVIKKRWDEISNCLKQHDAPHIVAEPLYLFCVDNDKQGTLEMIDHHAALLGYAKLENIALLYVGLDEKEKARKLLKASELCECSKLWYFLFNDKKTMYKILQEIEYDNCTIPLIKAAEIWEDIYDDTARSQCCLEKAEDAAVRLKNLGLNCAKAWMTLFNNANRAELCFDSIKLDATVSFDWIEIAEAYKVIFNADNAAYQSLEKAENLIECSTEWTECAMNWERIFNDDARAERCRKKAKLLIKNNKKL